MQVVQYLKEHGIGKLVSEFGIKVKEYDEGLLVLNYDLIESPKSHPIVMECRSLILDKQFNVVSRSFDRFFNLGEQPQTQEHIDWSKAVCMEKVDGSLIKVYNWNGRWYIATRGTAFAESPVNGFAVTFQELVLRAINRPDHFFQEHCNTWLDPEFTYIFELTSTENRVVKVYEGYKLHYLGARNNATGKYGDVGHEWDAMIIGAKGVKQYRFSSAAECEQTASHLKDLDEGYVLWQDGKPVCKIKSPAYVAVHHIRGEGLNPKRISQLVLTGEAEEYLTYFPEDRNIIQPYMDARMALSVAMFEAYRGTFFIATQKDFALAVKDLPFSGVLFKARKVMDTGEVNLMNLFNEQSEQSKIRILEQFL
jgi:T4 RnlA family RNA ligase